jgi:hypothetical protein
MGVDGQRHTLALLLPWEEWLAGHRGPSGRVRKTLFPIGFRNLNLPASSDLNRLKSHQESHTNQLPFTASPDWRCRKRKPAIGRLSEPNSKWFLSTRVWWLSKSTVLFHLLTYKRFSYLATNNNIGSTYATYDTVGVPPGETNSWLKLY